MLRLLEKARSGVLSDEEVGELTGLAVAAGLAGAVVRELVASLPHGPANLRRSRDLIAASNAERPRPRPPPRAKRDQGAHRFGSLLVSHHAVERYAQRYEPGVPMDEVLRRLGEQAASAVPVRETTVAGDFVWRSSDGVLFVVRRDAVADSRRRAPLAVTVLPPDSQEARRRAR